MNNENENLYKEWFKRLFHAFHNDETAIEFQADDLPPNEFLEIINKSETIKVISNVWYWFKEDEYKIINQAIDYIVKTYHIDDKIKSKDFDERKKLEMYPDEKDKVEEWEMQKKIIDDLGKSESIFPGFCYLFKYERVPIGSDGEDDLIITDGRGIFAVMKIKMILNVPNKNDRKRKLSYVVYQIGLSKREFFEFVKENQTYKDKDDHSFDVIAVIGVGVTEKNKKKFFGTFDEQVCEAFNRDTKRIP
ncbi:hypothetical protein C1645_804479 [Glomus cerebriforme]|uniref:Uncharacterized protein n=1 Tax=Glomus cerebriforme TaxID=658196 RepID=A0A397TCT2_9GLOM|nr:hypothetical protein C1645_804479 [Glomus cerebriforme]